MLSRMIIKGKKELLQKSKSVKKQGKLLITVEAGKNLRMEVNGRNYAVPLEGYGRFALD